jgi:isopenicillin-N epimerase
VKAGFPLHEDRIPMNAANLAPAPRSVVERTLEVMWSVDGDVSFQNRGRWESLLEETREGLARQVGASADEVALVRNTSEANNIVIGGLPLGQGDEVVVFDQNHPTNAVAWDVRAARYGFRVRRISAPEDPLDPGEVAAHFIGALGPETRVLAFSDISNVSGLRLPVAEICRACRERGVHAHVDGAQSLGSVALDLTALGCDSYASSAHKWYMGPKEAGLLFIRREKVEEIWPGVVGVGWGSVAKTSAEGARKFETLGQRNDATLVALGAAVEFHEAIGPERIEARVLELAGWLRADLAEIAGLKVVTPSHADLHHGVVVSRIEGVDEREVFESLYRDFGVAGAATGGLRLCPHIYNTRSDLDRAVEGVGALVGRLARG